MYAPKPNTLPFLKPIQRIKLSRREDALARLILPLLRGLLGCQLPQILG